MKVTFLPEYTDLSKPRNIRKVMGRSTWYDSLVLWFIRVVLRQ